MSVYHVRVCECVTSGGLCYVDLRPERLSAVLLCSEQKSGWSWSTVLLCLLYVLLSLIAVALDKSYVRSSQPIVE